MGDDMQFAIIAAIQEMSAAALLSSKRMMAIQPEESSRSDSACADHDLATPALRVTVKRFHLSSSHDKSFVLSPGSLFLASRMGNRKTANPSGNIAIVIALRN
jgi:hypothetical protein